MLILDLPIMRLDATLRMLTLFADDKTVCSCSGKTVWQEREEQRDRGML